MSQPALEPMTWSEILDRSFTLYRRHFARLYLIFLVPQLLSWIVGLAFQVRYQQFAAQIENSDDPAQMLAGFAAMLPVLAVAVTVGLFVVSLQFGALTLAVSRATFDEPITIGEAFQGSFYRMPSMLGTLILTGLLTGVGIVLCCLPGIFLMLALYLVIPAVIIEEAGPIAAISRSYELMMHRSPDTMHPLVKAGIIGLLIFAVQMAVGAVGALPNLLLGMGLGISAAVKGNGTPDMATLTQGLPLLLLAATTAFQTVVQALVPPLTATASVMLFYDLKMRREGFDLLEDDALSQPSA